MTWGHPAMTEQFVRDRQQHREAAARRSRTLKAAGLVSLFDRLVAMRRRRPERGVADDVIDLRRAGEPVSSADGADARVGDDPVVRDEPLERRSTV